MVETPLSDRTASSSCRAPRPGHGAGHLDYGTKYQTPFHGTMLVVCPFVPHCGCALCGRASSGLLAISASPLVFTDRASPALFASTLPHGVLTDRDSSALLACMPLPGVLTERCPPALSAIMQLPFVLTDRHQPTRRRSTSCRLCSREAKVGMPSCG